MVVGRKKGWFNLDMRRKFSVLERRRVGREFGNGRRERVEQDTADPYETERPERHTSRQEEKSPLCGTIIP